MKKNIQKLKTDLLERFDITSDRDLVKQLGIKDEDKKKLYAWIEYQCAFAYNEGFNDGQENLKELLAALLTPNRKL